MSDDGLPFSWHPAKAAANIRIGRISFERDTLVFDGPHVIYDVSRPEDGEPRYKALGIVEGRMLSVVFTIDAPTTFHLISVRPAHAKEQAIYRAIL